MNTHLIKAIPIEKTAAREGTLCLVYPDKWVLTVWSPSGKLLERLWCRTRKQASVSCVKCVERFKKEGVKTREVVSSPDIYVYDAYSGKVLITIRNSDD